ncbi:MAG TPA: phosphoribosylamine--glycine ligase [Acidobacteriota bacterium]|nr:phosphoribosylamine--glycine ligase [Acidobacteriota bacterium]
MKILVIGSGAREHALCWKLKQSPELTGLFCAPGNAGTSQLAENLPIGAEDIDRLVDFAVSRDIDLTVVGPEAPLVAGLVDRFEAAGLRAVGPSSAAAQLEGSKSFAKDFMRRWGIPTADYQIYTEPSVVEADLRAGRYSFPVVVKADGLAAGKGVFICPDLDSALAAVAAVMRERQFGSSGDRLVVEEFLQGEEASFMVFSDGRRYIPMTPSQDHKAVFDGDKGPNTGGMGAYSIDAILSPDTRDRVLKEIIEPTIRGMEEEGKPFRGILYAGLMLTQFGPKVLEFNVRFGDPETQVVLPRLQTDLLPVLAGIADGDLSQVEVKWNGDAVVCVVLASRGYPGAYEKGKEITGLEMAAEARDTMVFHAGTANKDGKVVSSGGRVLGITARARSLDEAIVKAYEGVNKVYFEGMYYRRDIAAKGLKNRYY